MMLKKGDKVVMHTCAEAEQYEGKIWTCQTDEQKLHKKHDFNVVWLEGFGGCFDAQFLQKVVFENTDLEEGCKEIYQWFENDELEDSVFAIKAAKKIEEMLNRP